MLHLTCSSEYFSLSFKFDFLGALSSKLQLVVSATSEGPQKQEQLLEKSEQKMKIMESEKIKGEQKNSVTQFTVKQFTVWLQKLGSPRQ